MAVNLTYLPRPGDPPEMTASRFKKKVIISGLLKEVRAHDHFVKPSTAKRIKQAFARKRALKHATKEGEPKWRLIADERRWGNRA